MLGTEETRTTGERYISASNTSDLTIQTAEHARNTGDILLAAGAALVKRTQENLRQHQSRTGDLSFGEALLKLRGEFDAAVRDLGRVTLPKEEPAQRIKEHADEYALRLAIFRTQRALQHQREAERQNYSERLQMLVALPSMNLVKTRAVAWLKERDLSQSVAEGVIRFWLDPLCIACNGRRWLTAAGTGRLTSKACAPCSLRNGTPTGERPFPPGQGAQWLYDHMQRAAGEFPPAAQRKMR